MQNKLYYFFFLSIIFYFGFDNHFGLHLELTNSYSILTIKLKDNIYLASLIVGAVIFILILSFLLITKEKGVKILSVFLATIILYSIYDDSKSIKNLKDYDNAGKRIFEKPKLIFVFDEASGIGGFESSSKEGKIYEEKLRNLSKKY